MDELIQQQIRQRDYDIEKAKERLPPPPVATTIAPTPLQSNSMNDSVFKDTVDTRMTRIEQTLEKLHKTMERILAKFSDTETRENPTQHADSAPENK
jgi:hypothetical protein